MYSRGGKSLPSFGKRSGQAYKKSDRGKYQLTVNEKACKRLKSSLKSITRKTSPISLKERLAKICEIQRGCLPNPSLNELLPDSGGFNRKRRDRMLDPFACPVRTERVEVRRAEWVRWCFC